MSNFQDREKAFENKFAHDKEMNFKAIAKRNKLLGLWAAEKLGKTGQDADEYAKEVVIADFEEVGDNDVINKIIRDFTSARVTASENEIISKMSELLPVAKAKIMQEIE
ncbi:MAG: DUF1476 domain-containing protein [Rickettsiales bacterium]